MFCDWVRFGTKFAQKELFDKKAGLPATGGWKVTPACRNSIARTRWLGKRDEQTFWFMGKHYGVQDEGVNNIRNSFWMDAPGEKVFELLDKELEPTISNNLISF